MASAIRCMTKALKVTRVKDFRAMPIGEIAQRAQRVKDIRIQFARYSVDPHCAVSTSPL
jgi:hypothetical protein